MVQVNFCNLKFTFKLKIFIKLRNLKKSFNKKMSELEEKLIFFVFLL